MKKLRIGIMLRHYDQPGGGVKVYTHNLMRHLLEIDTYNQYVLMYKNPDLIGTYASYRNVEEVAVKMPNKLLWDQLVPPWISYKHKLDIIFNLKLTIPFFGRGKKVFVLPGAEQYVVPEAFLWHDRLYFTTLARLYYIFADAIISSTNITKRDILKHIVADPKKFTTVNYGFDDKLFRLINEADRLSAVKQKYSLPDHFLLWVGQVAPLKNVNRLLRAFATLRDDIPHQLVITGGQQRWHTQEELQPIEELRLQDRVTFTGWVDDEDLPVLYNMADLFVFPSLYEGFGIPLIEAMACGCPVLTSNAGGPIEVVADAGYIVDPHSIDDIAHGIYEVLNNDQLRADMVAKGLVRAKDFSWDKCAQQTLNVLESLYSGQKLDTMNRAYN